jgi:hypothetical protein
VRANPRNGHGDTHSKSGQSLQFLLILHEGCGAWGHILDARTGFELAKSQPAAGRGGGEEWYQFLFGSWGLGTFQQQSIHLPDPDSTGAISQATCCAAAGQVSAPNRLVYVVDHRPVHLLRPTYKQMMSEAKSCDFCRDRWANH